MYFGRIIEALTGWARHPRLPRRSIRLRLTLLYGALFLLSGAALLTLTYTLNAIRSAPSPISRELLDKAAPAQRSNLKQVLDSAQQALDAQQRAAERGQLLISCLIALAVTAVFSIALGWLIANRVLRPLRAMTAAARCINDSNLHKRLALTGPDDELKQLGDTIDDLLARLERAFEAQRRFVANASHELRTPLTMMRTAVDVATTTSQPLAPNVTVMASRIRLGLDRADRLVASFLTLARAQHGAVVHRGAVALDRLAAATLAEHRTAVSDMHLTVEQDQHDAPIHGNEGLLTHLIDNLIDNAIRHNQPGGWIHVTTDTDSCTGTARLVVENGGTVLDQARVHELTEPFRRLARDRTSTADNGVGLGLSIAAAIVSTHSGSLDLHARPDGGLRVTASFPLARHTALTPAVSG
jgi:signal transduction histidine kinase